MALSLNLHLFWSLTQFSLAFPSFFLGVPLVFTWLSWLPSGFPLVFPLCSLVFTQFSLGFPQVPPGVLGFPLVSLWFSLFFLGVPLVFTWFSSGSPLVVLASVCLVSLFSLGFPLVFNSPTHPTHVFSQHSPRVPPPPPPGFPSGVPVSPPNSMAKGNRICTLLAQPLNLHLPTEFYSAFPGFPSGFPGVPFGFSWLPPQFSLRLPAFPEPKNRRPAVEPRPEAPRRSPAPAPAAPPPRAARPSAAARPGPRWGTCRSAPRGKEPSRRKGEESAGGLQEKTRQTQKKSEVFRSRCSGCPGCVGSL